MDYKAIEANYKSHLNIEIDSYKDIKEMRVYVNAIKHGKGKSFKKLLNELGDSVLADSLIGKTTEDEKDVMFKQSKYDENTLTSITLKYDGKLKCNSNAIIDFWKDVYKQLELLENGKK